MSKLEQLKSLLKQKQSNGWYASKLGVSVEDVIDLKAQLKGEEENVSMSTEVDYRAGTSVVTVESNKPLQPKEIEQLSGADNISIFLERYWVKGPSAAGKWTYTIQLSHKIKDFYNNKELEAKLKEIFSDVDPAITTEVVKNDKKETALFIYIADDHTGLQMKGSMYGNDYSGSIYAKRLLRVAEKVQSLNQVFDVLYVVRLGDELDGWNAKTTRYDHDLNSLSNKEQFDIYTTANKIFYNELFSKSLAVDYHIITLNNSNHSGKGYSYIANKALEYWLEGRFPDVKVKYQEKFIDHIQFGNHFIALTHGKDEVYMKSPMPLVLDAKTDLYLMEYFKKHSPKYSFNSTIKGDIHKHGMQYGKSGRYVNVPSIAGGSNWIEHNFGDTDPGVLLEIYTDDSKDIQTIPIWFK